MLTGFMGCGKTTVGLLLAEKLGRTFIDADLEIERQHGQPVTEIFRTLGEPAFRRMEKEFMLDLCRNASRQVVSLGGGAFMQEEIREACLSSAAVFFLKLDWEAWQQRHHLLMDTRPLLQQKTPEEIRDLFEARQALYALSHWTVDTNGLTPEQVADAIIRLMESA